jgi:hypothetical protein
MNFIDFPIERINEFFANHTFEVYLQPTHDEDYSVPTNVKVKLTGVKDYYHVGDKKPHVEYTIYILPTNETSDRWSKLYGDIYGKKVSINTTSQQYANIRWIMNEKLTDFLQYFGVEKKAICTRVINEVAEDKLNESILVEGKLDKATRLLVKDIISFFKYQKEGEFVLPEDIENEEMIYLYPGIEGFVIRLILELSDDVDTVDVDAELRYGDSDIIVQIISNPNAGNSVLEELSHKLNEVIRHELEHIKQHDEGFETPKEEIDDPEVYYTQQHELEAQRAGFNRKSKTTKLDFETVVRDWFEKNPHRHSLNPTQKEKVIAKILNNV